MIELISCGLKAEEIEKYCTKEWIQIGQCWWWSISLSIKLNLYPIKDLIKIWGTYISYTFYAMLPYSAFGYFDYLLEFWKKSYQMEIYNSRTPFWTEMTNLVQKLYLLVSFLLGIQGFKKNIEKENQPYLSNYVVHKNYTLLVSEP